MRQNYAIDGCGGAAPTRRLLATGDADYIQIIKQVLAHVPSNAVVDMATITARYSAFNATFVLHWDAAGGGASVVVDTITITGDTEVRPLPVVNGSRVGTTPPPYVWHEVTSVIPRPNVTSHGMTKDEYLAMFGQDSSRTSSDASRIAILGINLLIGFGLVACLLQ